MSRSGYSDDIDDDGYWGWIRWRGQVASAIRGQRGQLFLMEMAQAMDALPERRLIADALRHEGSVCAIGTVGAARGLDMESMNPEDYKRVAESFGIARQLVQEIEYINDEGHLDVETPEQRWFRVRAWIDENIRTTAIAGATEPVQSVKP